MSILDGFFKTKKYRKTDSGYKIQSEWTSSQTVYMDDGNTLQTNLGSIKGITSSLASTATNYALSASSGKNLQDQVTALNSKIPSTIVTGVKGNTESSYRTGNVNLTPANIGAAEASHTHSYLPLSGGTVNGEVHVNGELTSNTRISTYNTAKFYANTGNGSTGGGQFFAEGNNTYVVANNNTSNTWLKLLAIKEIQCQGIGETSWIPISASSFTTQSNSSRTLKDNIKDITDERARQILDVKVVTFDYKENAVAEEHRYNRTGVIAEDTESICPEVINYDNGKPSGVQYDRFIPYLIKMVQLQQDEIETLKKYIVRLEGIIKTK